MFKKYKAFSLLFLIVIILQLIATYYSLSRLNLAIESGILLFLMIFFAVKTALKGRFHKRLFTGLVFLWLFSVLLLLDNVPSVYGWTCYLFTHLFYIRAFYLDFRSAQELDKKNARIAIASCSIFGMGFYILIRPYLGEMRLAVMLFTFVSAMMLMMSVFRNLRVNRESFVFVFAGVLLFALTDVLLALDKFTGPFPFASVLTMVCFTAAQFLIVIGGLERKLLNV